MLIRRNFIDLIMEKENPTYMNFIFDGSNFRGYFNESEEKGSRRYLTFGAGFKYNNTNIDISYLSSTSKIRNPLENTLRFSLTFNFNSLSGGA